VNLWCREGKKRGKNTKNIQERKKKIEGKKERQKRKDKEWKREEQPGRVTM